jgi:hypothetical protein
MSLGFLLRKKSPQFTAIEADLIRDKHRWSSGITRTRGWILFEFELFNLEEWFLGE